MKGKDDAEEEKENAAEWKEKARESESDTIAFLGNEDGLHGNCS